MIPWSLAVSLSIALALDGEVVPPSHSDAAPIASVSTLVTTPLVIEGLTASDAGELYAPGRNAGNGIDCPVYRAGLAEPAVEVVGRIPAPESGGPCSPSGLAFGPDGLLYVTEGSTIYRLAPDASSPPRAVVFASGVPGANGVAFDRDGSLWTGDGTTGQGRIWKISRSGEVAEPLRIPPLAIEVAPGVAVGRDVRTLPLGTIDVTPTTRNASNTQGSQPLVANGLAFDGAGDLLVADTARGALWRVRFGPGGSLLSRTGCDATLPANTLCLDNVHVAHPLLEGVDGIALDVAGNVWAVANERNAILFIDRAGRVTEVFRNPVDPQTLRRNGGPLESPASPVLVGQTLCTSNSDGSRRDNSPNTAGEIGGAGQPRGKVSCLDQALLIPGAPLPVR